MKSLTDQEIENVIEWLEQFDDYDGFLSEKCARALAPALALPPAYPDSEGRTAVIVQGDDWEAHVAAVRAITDPQPATEQEER